jgi:hypothetical protein
MQWTVISDQLPYAGYFATRNLKAGFAAFIRLGPGFTDHCSLSTVHCYGTQPTRNFSRRGRGAQLLPRGRALHRTQPAVSQVIRKLEASVGETLFDRAARDGSLTAAGLLLRDYALRLLALRREASSALDELKSLERGRLQLAANEYTCMYLLPGHRPLPARVSSNHRDRAPHAGLAHS